MSSTGRFLFCATPAQGHVAPLLAVTRQLVVEGHEVVFFTTEHYRDRVVATGARFLPFGDDYDAHDLMAANPEREPSSNRGIRGLKDDLRRIFIGPVPQQFADLQKIRAGYEADVIVFDAMFFGALALGLAPQPGRPRLVCIGVMPFAGTSRDAATFGPALQPGSGPLSRLRNRCMNWATEHVALRDIQRFTRRRMAECGVARAPGYFIDLPTRAADAYLQATVRGFEYPRSDLPANVRFVGPTLNPPSSFAALPAWWDELEAGRPVVHVTQGTLDNADLSRLLTPTMEALAHDDVLVVATTGGPDPEPLRASLPANVRLERFIPHDLLLPHVAVMVTNGGYGGVQQALANGVPLVVAGNSEDKPEVAARVRWSGTGIDLRTGRPSPAKVARAVRRVLSDPAFTMRARALRDEIAGTDPVRDICAVLVELSAAPRPAGPASPRPSTPSG